MFDSAGNPDREASAGCFSESCRGENPIKETSMQINVNGISLHYKTEGAGKPLLLLHGNGEDHRIFDELGEKLRDTFTLYAIDSRNHGQSSKTDVYSYETMAEDVHAFIQALNLGKVYVLGFSDGAIISLLLAMRHGGDIEKMALLGVNLNPGDLNEESALYIRGTYERTHDPLFKLMLEQPDISPDELKAVTVPTLVVGAENDIYRPGLFEEIAAALPDAQLQIMPGHVHDSYIVHQDMLFPDLERFFK